jgi:hypothetical protein
MDKLKFSSVTVGKFRLSNLAGIVGETLDLINPLAGLLGDMCVKTTVRLSLNLAKMKSEMDKNHRNPLTEPIRKANNECDVTFNEIKRTAKVGEQSIIPAKAEAGKNLMFFLKPFWNLNKEPMVSQIGMTEELLKRYNNQQQLQSAAQTLGFSELFTALTQQNTLLNTLYNQRLDGYAAESPAASNMRNVVVEDYEGVCTIVVKTVNLEPVQQPVLDLFHKMDDLRKKYSVLSPSRIDIRHAVTEPIATQKHTGKAITPIPVAYYEGTELTFAKDFNVTYKHNVEVGEAMVILHGKGKFTGSHERRFNIEKVL